MMLIPRHYEPEMRAFAHAVASRGKQVRGDVVLNTVLEHGFNQAERDNVIIDRIAPFTADGMRDYPSLWFEHFRRHYRPDAWFFFFSVFWNDDDAVSRRMEQAFAYVHLRADNDNATQAEHPPRDYPVVVPAAWEHQVRELAAEWGISPRAALCAVLEVAFADFRDCQKGQGS